MYKIAQSATQLANCILLNLQMLIHQELQLPTMQTQKLHIAFQRAGLIVFLIIN